MIQTVWKKSFTNLRPYCLKEYLLLPLIAKEKETAKHWLRSGFKGIYYKDINKPQWGEKIILLFDADTIDIKAILNYSESEYKYSTYNETINGKSYQIFAFIVPPKFKKDYNLIINGDYKEISSSTCTKILNFYTDTKFHINYHKECLEKILYNRELASINKKYEYTDGFGKEQILNLNQVNFMS